MTSLNVQHDGDHYKNRAIQPIEFCQKNELNACESFAIKHITRHRDKGEGITDLKKAIHYLQMLLEMEYGVRSDITHHDNSQEPLSDPGHAARSSKDVQGPAIPIDYPEPA